MLLNAHNTGVDPLPFAKSANPKESPKPKKKTAPDELEQIDGKDRKDK